MNIKTSENRLPDWIKKIGTLHEPKSKKNILADSYGAKGDGTTNSTKPIQKAIKGKNEISLLQ